MRKEGESKWAGDGREEKEDNGLEHLLTHSSSTHVSVDMLTMTSVTD